MAARIAWVLNLDADLELGAGAAYEPGKRVTRAMKAPVERLAASLLGTDDVVLDAADQDPPAPRSAIGRGLPGRAFCPTPRALEILRRAGARPEPHPSVDILRRVNSRAFASALGVTLPGAAFVTDREAARAILRAEPPIGHAWRIKHAFGMAGRNQRVVAPSPIDPRDLAFVAAGLAGGGVQIEPDVAVEEEYAVHAFLHGDAALRVAPITRQRCDARGAWLATEPIASGGWSTRHIPDRIVEECHRVAGALSEAGYFGPFGVDAYTFRDAGGEVRLQPRSEINARYSMGFPRSLVPGAESGA